MQSREFKSEKFDSRPKILPIKKIIEETKSIRTFVFDYSEFSHLGSSKPGQFVMLWIPGVDEKPFSIAYDSGGSGKRKAEFWLTIAKVGPATAELFKLKEGDFVGVRGPFGTSYEWSKGEHLALLAGGYGAAPLYGVARAAVEDGCKVEFIVGARNKNLLLYEERIEELAKKYNGKNAGGKIFYYAATDDGSYGHKGYNTDVLAQVLKKKIGLWGGGARGSGARGGRGASGSARDGWGASGSASGSGKIDRIFACGPEIMMKKAAEMAAKARVKCQLSLERYMKCGFGVCGQCCMDDSGICVCKDGPVYDGAAALKLREFGRYYRDGVGRRVER